MSKEDKTNADQMVTHKPNGQLARGHTLGNRFEKGSSGNSAGRPRGAKNVSTILKERLAKVAPDSVLEKDFIRDYCKGKKRITHADVIAARLLYSAQNGDAWAVKEILDRTEGRARLAIDSTEELANAMVEASERMVITFSFPNTRRLRTEDE